MPRYKNLFPRHPQRNAQTHRCADGQKNTLTLLNAGGLDKNIFQIIICYIFFRVLSGLNSTRKSSRFALRKQSLLVRVLNCAVIFQENFTM